MFVHLQGEPGIKLVEKTAEVLPADDKMANSLTLPTEIEQAIEETKGIRVEGPKILNYRIDESPLFWSSSLTLS